MFTVNNANPRMDTGIIGSVTVMKSYVSDFGSQSATVHGLIVSAILIPAALSSFLAGRVADVLGRPKNIAIGALIFGLGAALEAGAVTIVMFVVGRIVEGIGEGLYLGTLVVQVNPHRIVCYCGNLNGLLDAPADDRVSRRT